MDQTFNNYEEFVSFLNDHPELKTIYDLKQNYRYAYDRFYNLKDNGSIPKDAKIPLKWKTRDNSTRKDYGDTFKTLKEFQDHVDKKGYKNSREFEKNEPQLFAKMGREGFSSQINYPNRAPRYNTGFYDTVEKCQMFIDKNGVEKFNDLRVSKDPEFHSVFLSIKSHRWQDEINWKK